MNVEGKKTPPNMHKIIARMTQIMRERNLTKVLLMKLLSSLHEN